MENKSYPTIKHAILLCLLLLGIQLGFGFLIGILQYILNISENSLIAGVFNIFISVISFIIVLLIGFKKTKRNFNEVFKINNVSIYLWLAVIIFSLGFVILSSELDNIILYFLPMPEWFKGLFGTLMIEQPLIISIIYIGLVAALSEELFFRGLILDGLYRNYSKRKAIIISAILFGIIHLNPWQFVSAFIMGLIMAWILIESKSIWLCVYFHLFNNLLYTITERNRDLIPIKGFNNAFQTSIEFQPLWFTLSGLLILSVGTIMLIKGFKKNKTSV